MASDGTDMLTNCGETRATSGFLGLGKLIPSNSTGGSEDVDGGLTTADGRDSMVSKFIDSGEH